jgi:ABC-type polysaccharide/polyol phosphate export permease
VNISDINWPTFIIILLIGIITMWGLGIIAAGIQLVTKQWNPVTWLLSAFSMFVSGVFYTPEALFTVDPSGTLYKIAWCLPQT